MPLRARHPELLGQAIVLECLVQRTAQPNRSAEGVERRHLFACVMTDASGIDGTRECLDRPRAVSLGKISISEQPPGLGILGNEHRGPTVKLPHRFGDVVGECKIRGVSRAALAASRRACSGLSRDSASPEARDRICSNRASALRVSPAASADSAALESPVGPSSAMRDASPLDRATETVPLRVLHADCEFANARLCARAVAKKCLESLLDLQCRNACDRIAESHYIVLPTFIAEREHVPLEKIGKIGWQGGRCGGGGALDERRDDGQAVPVVGSPPGSGNPPCVEHCVYSCLSTSLSS